MKNITFSPLPLTPKAKPSKLQSSPLLWLPQASSPFLPLDLLSLSLLLYSLFSLYFVNLPNDFTTVVCDYYLSYMLTPRWDLVWERLVVCHHGKVDF